MNVDELADMIDTFMYKRMVNKLEEDERVGLHVTDIVYPCMRRAYFFLRDRDNGNWRFNGDKSSAIVLFIGKQLHEYPFTGQNEVAVQYGELQGSIDEIVETEDMVVILDKKTTRKIGSSPHEHHKKQVLYYTVMYSEMYPEILGKKLYGCVWYLDVANLNSRAFVWEITPEDLAVAKKEIDMKLAILRRAREEGKVPEPVFGWWCSYTCPYMNECYMEYGGRLEDMMREVI